MVTKKGNRIDKIPFESFEIVNLAVFSRLVLSSAAYLSKKSIFDFIETNCLVISSPIPTWDVQKQSLAAHNINNGSNMRPFDASKWMKKIAVLAGLDYRKLHFFSLKLAIKLDDFFIFCSLIFYRRQICNPFNFNWFLGSLYEILKKF